MFEYNFNFYTTTVNDEAMSDVPGFRPMPYISPCEIYLSRFINQSSKVFDCDVNTEHVPGYPPIESLVFPEETFSPDVRGIPADDCFPQYPVYSDEIHRFYLMFIPDYAEKVSSENKEITLCGDKCIYRGSVIERSGHYPKCITIGCDQYATNYRHNLCKVCAVSGTNEYAMMHKSCGSAPIKNEICFLNRK